jgi:hypothetical protein
MMSGPYLSLERTLENQSTLTLLVPQGLRDRADQGMAMRLHSVRYRHGHDLSSSREMIAERSGRWYLGTILRE